MYACYLKNPCSAELSSAMQNITADFLTDWRSYIFFSSSSSYMSHVCVPEFGLFNYIKASRLSNNINNIHKFLFSTKITDLQIMYIQAWFVFRKLSSFPGRSSAAKLLFVFIISSETVLMICKGHEYIQRF